MKNLVRQSINLLGNGEHLAVRKTGVDVDSSDDYHQYAEQICCPLLEETFATASKIVCVE